MTIHEILKSYWGYSSFRPFQEEIIRSVLEGKDTLALLPTGGGKSVCYQVPALSQEGLCIVVSPLIALMKDQVENLQSRGIAAKYLISGMNRREIDVTLDNCIYGNTKFLYLSPERLQSSLVIERLKHMKVNLIAIDEAHCISQWGYDFRPSYLALSALRVHLPQVPVLALTATATEKVRVDILDKLEMSNAACFQSSFRRDNLVYVVYREEDKLKRILAALSKVSGTAILYVRTRKETQELSSFLNKQRISADFYHAGLSTKSRFKRQELWKQGKTRVMVCTNAFGMGIDKPDVRLVIHYAPTDSLEAYYQEAGRAGRDGKKSYALLLHEPGDKMKLQQRVETEFPTEEEIRQVYHHLGNYFQLAIESGEGLSLPFDIAEFCNRYHLQPLKTLNACKLLERSGYVALSEAVFLPSRVRILLSGQDLYAFQVAHMTYDLFIKTLLRISGAMFDFYTKIEEGEMAKRMNLSLEQVVQLLRELEKHQVLHYIPQTDAPQITFLQARRSFNELYLDGKFMKNRKLQMTERINSVLHYLETPRCRSQQLLEYFGEEDSACGTCDICIAEKHQSTSSLDKKIEHEIIRLLHLHVSLSVDELLKGIDIGKEEDKHQVIRNMLDASLLKIENGYCKLS